MTNKVTFYVPSTAGLSDKISEVEHNGRMLKVAKFFSELFGGATATKDATGFYVADSGELVEESIIQVSSFCLSDNFQELVDEVFKFAQELNQDWQQESILVDVAGEVQFVQ